MLGREVLERLGQLNRQPLNSVQSPSAPAPAVAPAHSLPALPPAAIAARAGLQRSGSSGELIGAPAENVSSADTFRPLLMHRPPAAPAAATTWHGASRADGSAAAGSGVACRPLRGRECPTVWGAHWQIDQRLCDLVPGWHQEWLRAAPLLTCMGTDEETHAEQRAFASSFPQRVMYLDLETCGFAGSLVFLAGVLHHTNEGWMLSQLLARNYAEEKALLESLWRIAARHEVLVTFNGKSFDWPVVHDRSTLHHLGRPLPANSEQRSTLPREDWPAEHCGLTRSDSRPELCHYDLLHHCRRRWRGRLPNCRLQTLERYICGRRRSADIPSHLIPQAYHEFVRTSETRHMRSVLHHNALDLITLFQLSLRIVLVP